MGDSLYPTQSGRPPNPNQPWTPQSAVSSFNFPAEYNPDLTTPVSADTPLQSRGSSIPNWSQNNSSQMNYAKLASSMSHTSSMKSKNFSSSLQVSDTNVNPSLSPYIYESPQSAYPHTPYASSYSVSAHPDNASGMPPPINSSHSSKQNSISLSPLSTGSMTQAPILGTPNPEALRPQKRLHDSISSQGGQISPQYPVHNEQEPVDQALGHGPSIFIQEESPPFRNQSNKRPRTSPVPDTTTTFTMPAGADNNESKLTELDLYILYLRKNRNNLNWKATTKIFNDRFGTNSTVQALQMRNTRANEKSRVWTDKDTSALDLAMKAYGDQRWDMVSREMMNAGSGAKWTAKDLKKKYAELHPEEAIDVAEGLSSAGPEAESIGKEASAAENQGDDDHRSPGSRGGTDVQRRKRRRRTQRSRTASSSRPTSGLQSSEDPQVWMLETHQVPVPVSMSMQHQLQQQQINMIPYRSYSSSP